MDHIFYLRLENDVCSAKVTAIDHPYQQMYHVTFDDGYENIFFVDVETGNWVEEDLGETMLAANFGAKVCLLSGLTPVHCKTLAWCRATVAGKIINFGFHIAIEKEETIFEVYGETHKFLYLLKNKAGRWQVLDWQECIAPAYYTDEIKIVISIFKGLAGHI